MAETDDFHCCNHNIIQWFKGLQLQLIAFIVNPQNLLASVSDQETNRYFVVDSIDSSVEVQDHDRTSKAFVVGVDHQFDPT